MNTGRGLVAQIAGFAAIGFAALALIYWALLANPPLSFAGIDWTLRIFVIIAIVAFSVFLLAAPETIGQAAGRKSNRLTANAIIAAVVAVAIAIVLNVVIEALPSIRGDWTAAKEFSLSAQTSTVLKELDSRKLDVQAVAFIRPGQTPNQQQIEDLLKEYRARTTRLKYEVVDPYQSPARASQYGVTRLGSVVFDTGTKREIATGATEADFSGALIRLLETGTKSVAFLTGHGERDIAGFDELGYSSVNDVLQKDNYKTVTWSLTTSPTLTVNDPTVLVIAEPKKPLTAKEVQTVQGYLDAGGHAMILLDPLMPTDALKSVAPILQKYGVTAVQGGVIDLQNNYSPQEPTAVGVRSYPSTSPITEDLQRDKLPVLFPLALGLRPPTSTLDLLDVTSIIQSSVGEQASWLETDINPDVKGQVALRYDANKDVAGPVTMGLTVGPKDVSASTTTTPTNQVKTRLVVFGDSDFPSNLILQQGYPVYNSDLFANSISWLSGANELMSIRAKDTTQARRIALNTQQQTVLFASTVIALPLLVILFGVYIWWRRR